MGITTTGLIITIVIALIGFVGGIFFCRWKNNPIDKRMNEKLDKKMNETLKDPHKLLEKLQEHGTIYDHGEKLNMSVEPNEEGIDTLVIKGQKVKKAPSPTKEESKQISGKLVSKMSEKQRMKDKKIRKAEYVKKFGEKKT